MLSPVERAATFEHGIDEILTLYRVYHSVLLPPRVVPRDLLELTFRVQLKLLQERKEVIPSLKRNVSVYSDEFEQITYLQLVVREVGASLSGTETSSEIHDYSALQNTRFKFRGVQTIEFK